jgi:hypothetical protein
MKRRNAFSSSGPAGSVLAVFFALATAGAQAKVQPPPLPAGSTLVKPQAGMDDDEGKRQVRAHRNKTGKKRDYTRDDSESDDSNSRNGNDNDRGRQDNNRGRK